MYAGDGTIAVPAGGARRAGRRGGAPFRPPRMGTTRRPREERGQQAGLAPRSAPQTSDTGTDAPQHRGRAAGVRRAVGFDTTAGATPMKRRVIEDSSGRCALFSPRTRNCGRGRETGGADEKHRAAEAGRLLKAGGARGRVVFPRELHELPGHWARTAPIH